MARREMNLQFAYTCRLMMFLRPAISTPIRSAASILLLLIIFSFSPAKAEDPQLEFTLVGHQTGIVDITNAADGSGRLFLVDQTGRIFIQQDGLKLATPFLDIRDRVMSGGERGLLSLAFPLDFATSGFFYVWYTRDGGDTLLSRFRVSEDGNVADQGSEVTILTVEQPFGNHNGGRLQFGHDGMLYLGLGDGGSGFDPGGRGQDRSTLLGKLIRIDVNPVHGTYEIPADNPFLDDEDTRDEIWALGLRNPWRISVDRLTGDLYIADVGQGEREEVNFQAARSTGGQNYGWVVMEGTRCVVEGCDQDGLTLPVSEYTHDEGCSVIGGEVYRGHAYPRMRGIYLYGDLCSGRIWGLKRVSGTWETTLLADTEFVITTFGVAENGNLYVASSSGEIYLVSDGAVVAQGFVMNAGLNDAWYNILTPGQGFFITVFPKLGLVSIAWITYDTTLPPLDARANVGDAGHRWIIGAEKFFRNRAVINAVITSNGLFDTATIIKRTQPEGSDGTMTLILNHCNAGTVKYIFPAINRQGIVPVQRVANDNISLCQALEQ